jgi:CRP-like cAMP-binding protein
MRDLSKGNVFGELALIHFTPRNSTVSCTESGLLLSLSQGDFFKFLLKNENSKFLENYIMCAKQFLSDSLKDTKLPVFDGLPDEEFPNLVKKCTWEWHNPETLIFKEGDIGTTFYIILFGILEVKKEQKILTTLGAEKGYFGEIALVTDQNRTANVYATTLSVLLSVTKNTFQEMFSSNPEFLAQFQVKLAPAQASLKHILFHMIGFKCFYKQMTAEHSTENIDFWRDAVAFSKLDSQEERIAFGKEIVKKYISKDAEQRVNLKGVTRKEILDICERDESYTKDFFEGAEREIFDLMERDSWARFKNGH